MGTEQVTRPTTLQDILLLLLIIIIIIIIIFVVVVVVVVVVIVVIIICPVLQLLRAQYEFWALRYNNEV
jgi:hypothetical protein